MENANTVLQEPRIGLLKELPPWTIPALGWFAWAFFHWQSAIPGLAVGLLVWRMADKTRQAREAAARVGACANVCCPQIVRSMTPYEGADVVAERAKKWRDDLEASGNWYWDKIPIIEYPFQPMIFEVGQISQAWDIYCRMAGEVQHTENIKWAAKCPDELRAIILSQVLPVAQETEIA